MQAIKRTRFARRPASEREAGRGAGEAGHVGSFFIRRSIASFLVCAVRFASPLRSRAVGFLSLSDLRSACGAFVRSVLRPGLHAYASACLRLPRGRLALPRARRGVHGLLTLRCLTPFVLRALLLSRSLCRRFRGFVLADWWLFPPASLELFVWSAAWTLHLLSLPLFLLSFVPFAFSPSSHFLVCCSSLVSSFPLFRWFSFFAIAIEFFFSGFGAWLPFPFGSLQPACCSLALSL